MQPRSINLKLPQRPASERARTDSAASGNDAGHDPTFGIVLISTYELGRQPFAVAEPAAWLEQAGFSVTCCDLSQQRLRPEVFSGAGLVAIHVGMHTATRIAIEAMPRIRAMAPQARLCAYGLYAPLNHSLLRSLGVQFILGGEIEPQLVSIAQRLRAGERTEVQLEPMVDVARVDFITPQRSGLPDLGSYAHLTLPDGGKRTVGFVEASRGCKHLCRHCPVVPVYEGRFRIVPVDVVMSDIEQQVRAGATHISFGDPDFLNGPTHARRVVAEMHSAFPQLSFDATIKVQHLIEHAKLLPEFRDAGLLLVTSAVESVDDAVLRHLGKNHTLLDFESALESCRNQGIALAPTFVAFHPWTTLDGYLRLLQTLVRLRLAESVPAIQLSIRLLVPQGSHLLDLRGFMELLSPFDRQLLGYPWSHHDPRVDSLQRAVRDGLQRGNEEGLSAADMFRDVWRLAHDALCIATPQLSTADFGAAVPRLSEPWYCCSEPTEQQLQSF